MYNPFSPFDTKLGFRLDRSDGFLLGLRHASSPLKGLGWVLPVENPLKLCFHAFKFFLKQLFRMFRKDKNFEVVGSLMAMVEQEEKEAENGSKEEPQLVALETRLPGRDVFLHLTPEWFNRFNN